MKIIKYQRVTCHLSLPEFSDVLAIQFVVCILMRIEELLVIHHNRLKLLHIK